MKPQHEPPNNGNLAIRRACGRKENNDGGERFEVYRRIMDIAGATAYQHMQEVGEYGSGSPSCLYHLCEVIREIHRLDLRDGTSNAKDLAGYSLEFFKSLIQENADTETSRNLQSLFADILGPTTDAMRALGDGELEDLSDRELRAQVERFRSAAAGARLLETMGEAILMARQKSRKSSLSAVGA